MDGTSASAPVFAGMITLINEALLEQGKPVLGFLNPMLYKMSSKEPKTFIDVTQGDNKCSAAACCKYGYSATAGWDPASGLGVPQFDAIKAYALTANDPTPTPTPAPTPVVPVEKTLIQRVQYQGLDPSDYTGDLKTLIEVAYGIILGIYNTTSTPPAFLTGCSVDSVAGSLRRDAYVTFTTTITAAQSNQAILAAQTLPSSMTSLNSAMPTAKSSTGITLATPVASDASYATEASTEVMRKLFMT